MSTQHSKVKGDAEGRYLTAPDSRAVRDVGHGTGMGLAAARRVEERARAVVHPVEVREAERSR